MMEMMLLYKWVFVLLVVASLCLSQLGVHLVARQQSLNSLMLTQVSSFGVLLGMLLNELFFHLEKADFILPLVFGLVMSFVVSFVVEKSKKDFGETFYLIVFLFFMACAYWLCAYFPAIDSHHADSYFGDIVTIEGVELYLSILGFTAGFIYLMVLKKRLLNESFEVEIFGKQRAQKKSFYFWPIAQSLMVLGIFSVGMLTTLSLMLMAPVVLSFRSRSLASYMRDLTIISSLCALGGFVMSLHFTRMSSAPTMVILLFVTASLLMLMRFVKARIN